MEDERVGKVKILSLIEILIGCAGVIGGLILFSRYSGNTSGFENTMDGLLAEVMFVPCSFYLLAGILTFLLKPAGRVFQWITLVVSVIFFPFLLLVFIPILLIRYTWPSVEK